MSQNPFHAAPGGQPDVIMDVEVAEPKMYQVLLHNDDGNNIFCFIFFRQWSAHCVKRNSEWDKTAKGIRSFVVNILMTVFHKTADQATNIMLAVHKRGKGIAGVYPHEIAETKVDKTHFLAREAGYPLRCTLEEVGA